MGAFLIDVYCFDCRILVFINGHSEYGRLMQTGAGKVLQLHDYMLVFISVY